MPPSPEAPLPKSDKQIETGTQSTPDSLPIATPVRRVAALVYDLLLLAAISLAYSAIILILRIFVQGSEAAQENIQGPLRYLFLAGWWLCLALFYSWCWRRSGQTLGMKTWNMRLEQADESMRDKGSLASWPQCWIRSLLAPPALLCFGLSYWYCFFNHEGHCLHDIWSHTQVVVLPKEKSRKQRKKEAAEAQRTSRP